MTSDSFDLEARLLPERIRLDLSRIGALLATEQLLSGLVVDNLARFLDPTAPMVPRRLPAASSRVGIPIRRVAGMAGRARGTESSGR